MYPIHEFFEKIYYKHTYLLSWGKQSTKLPQATQAAVKETHSVTRLSTSVRQILQRDNPAKVLTDSNAFGHSAMIKILVQKTAVIEKKIWKLSHHLWQASCHLWSNKSMPAVDQTHVVSNSLGLPVASHMQIKYDKINVTFANFDFFVQLRLK